ncbi:MAG: protease pro-enzyme activation domain-containing protein [Candidatus Thermoplasmatota archaeon]|nr:protease pro-enzyme activation domain-containing protein [Candidatus Thermoplasmatota archaeon]MCL5963876.1 protease pro-enzyme activation domain-containing protein [Candidatus Thermoplasmatota archaeon]
MKGWLRAFIIFITLVIFLSTINNVSAHSINNITVLMPMHGDLTHIRHAEFIGPYYADTLKLTAVLNTTKPIAPEIKLLTSRVYNHSWLTQSEINKTYGNYEAYIQFADYMNSYGISVSYTSIDLFVTLHGSTSQFSRALHVSFNLYRYKGSIFYSSTTPELPVSLASAIVSIYGLTNYSAVSAASLQKTASSSFTVPSQSPPYNVSQIENAYNITPVERKGYNGSGENIVIIGSGKPSISDLSSFFNGMNIPMPAYKFKYIDGNSSPPSALNSFSIETTLDDEWSGAIAPGAVIYTLLTPGVSSQDFTDMLIYTVTHLPGSIASISWGSAENSTGSAIIYGNHEIIGTGLLEGIAFFSSSGDFGGYDGMLYPSVNYWASDPYVTGVGGTQLIYNMTSSGWETETGWSRSGGGRSAFFSEPFYQSGTGVPYNGARNVPDVSYDASPSTGMWIFYQNSWIGIGGTSCGSPQWASIWAIIKEFYKGRISLGFPNPVIYQIGRSRDYNSAFHDIVLGYNGVYTAHPGWDSVTGWGTPIVTGLINAINNLSNFNVNFSLSLSSEYVPASINLTATVKNGVSPYSYTWYVPGVGTYTGKSTNVTVYTSGTYTVVLNVTDNSGNKASYTKTFTLYNPSYIIFNTHILDGVLYINNRSHTITAAQTLFTVPSGMYYISYWKYGYIPYTGYADLLPEQTENMTIALKQGNFQTGSPYSNPVYYSTLNSSIFYNNWAVTYGGDENSIWGISNSGYTTLYNGNNIYDGGTSYSTSLVNTDKYYTNLTEHPVLVTVNRLSWTPVPSNSSIQMAAGIQDLNNFNYILAGINVTGNKSIFYIEEGIYQPYTYTWNNSYLFSTVANISALSFSYSYNGSITVWNGSKMEQFSMFHGKGMKHALENVSLLITESYYGYRPAVASIEGIGLYNMNRYTVSGVILNHNGMPVSNALIYEGSTIVTVTGSNGYFHISAFMGVYTIKIIANGYITNYYTFTVTDNNISNVVIYLNPLSSSTGSFINQNSVQYGSILIWLVAGAIILYIMVDDREKKRKKELENWFGKFSS